MSGDLDGKGIDGKLTFLFSIPDWTVRLLMHNGKLAGRATYQDLLEFAFGRAGLIAISIFQFAFGFGGKQMVHGGENGSSQFIQPFMCACTC